MRISKQTEDFFLGFSILVTMKVIFVMHIIKFVNFQDWNRKLKKKSIKQKPHSKGYHKNFLIIKRIQMRKRNV